MRNDDQQQAAGDEQSVAGPRAVAPEPDRSPAPTPLLILASNDDLVCVEDLCLPAEASVEDGARAPLAKRAQTGPEPRFQAAAEIRS